MYYRVKTSPQVIDSSAFSLSPDLIQRILKRANRWGTIPGRATPTWDSGSFITVGPGRCPNTSWSSAPNGVSVVCLALGLKDNGQGQLSFIDPSYSLMKNGPFHTVGGQSKWNNPQKVKDHFARFGVDRWITHYKLRSDQFFPDYSQDNCRLLIWPLSTVIMPTRPSATISCKPPGGREKTATSSCMTPTSTCGKFWAMPGSNVSSRN